MNWFSTYTPYLWPMLVSALFLTALGLYGWNHRTVPGAAHFAIMSLFAALWSLATVLEIAATAQSKILWFKFELVVACVTLTTLLGFAIEYVNPAKLATHRNMLLLSFLLLLGVALVATNDVHYLIWKRIWFDEFIRIERGPLNLLVLGYFILLPLLAFLLFLQHAVTSSGIYRRQALMLFAGTAVPWVAFFLVPMYTDRAAPLYPVVLMFSMSGLLYSLAIFRYGMLSAVPVGRDMAIERMVGGILILDAENRIIDLNPAAREVLTLPRPATVGHPAARALAAHPDLLRLIEQEVSGGAEITTDKGGHSRFFQVHVSPLLNRRGFKLGRLVLLQDTTEQKHARELRLRQQRSLTIMQERERLGRELHDCLGQALASAHLLAETAQTLLARGDTEQVAGQLARLAEVTQAASADIRDYLLGLRTTLPAEVAFVASVREYVPRFSANYACPTELVIAPELETLHVDAIISLQLLRIIQEGLTNVRKHAAAQRVKLTLARTNGKLEMTLVDDGRGFDFAQLEGNAGYGLHAMRERAEAVGGAFEFHSTPGQGTEVKVRVPLEEPLGDGRRGLG